MSVNTNFLTTGSGSFPHVDSKELCQRLVETLDVPVWPQLPRRSFFENMYMQYSNGLPGLEINVKDEKITFNTNGDLLGEVEKFYERYLAEDIASFALQAEYADGFYSLLEVMQGTPRHLIKGQVTGPISFGLTVTDQDLRASLYNEYLADVIVKNMAMAARWQVQQLKQVSPNVIMVVDEPYLAAFGSAFISLSREEVISMLDEVFAAIHQEGGLAGVHCCANTDWSVLMATSVDFLNLDSYGFVENLALYPDELRSFLDRGGYIAWGSIPNNEEILTTTPEVLAGRLHNDIDMIAEKAEARGVQIRPEEFTNRSLITTSCGLGSTTIEIAEKVLQVQKQTGEILQQA